MAEANFEIKATSGMGSGIHITVAAGLDQGGAMPKALFDANTTEERLYKFEVPLNFASSMNVDLICAMSVTSGFIEWGIKVASFADGAALDAAAPFDTINTVSQEIDTTTSEGKFTVNVPLTNNDSMATSRTVLMHIQRTVSGSDTASGDLQLVGIFPKYTTT